MTMEANINTEPDNPDYPITTEHPLIMSSIAIIPKHIAKERLLSPALPNPTMAGAEGTLVMDTTTATTAISRHKKLNTEEEGRGRRIMGKLLGTLEGRQRREPVSREAEGKRRAVEERLASRLAAERALLEQTLAKEQEAKVHKEEEEQMIEFNRLTSFWDEQGKMVDGFRKTKTKPFLSWSPSPDYGMGLEDTNFGE